MRGGQISLSYVMLRSWELILWLIGTAEEFYKGKQWVISALQKITPASVEAQFGWLTAEAGHTLGGQIAQERSEV